MVTDTTVRPSKMTIGQLMTAVTAARHLSKVTAGWHSRLLLDADFLAEDLVCCSFSLKHCVFNAVISEVRLI